MDTPLSGKIFDDLAGFGLFWAKFGAGVGTVIGLVGLIVGTIMLLSHNQMRPMQTQATVKQVSCNPILSQGNLFQCTLLLEYNVKQVTHNATITVTSPRQYLVGETLIVRYNGKAPNDIELHASSYNYQAIGWATIFIALIFFVAGWLNFYLLRKFKGAAAFAGGRTAWGTLGVPLPQI